MASPISTIDAGPGVSLSQARALLGIPSWFDDADFIASDRYFDGDRFLVAAKRAGGLDELVADLVAKRRESKRARVRFLSPPTPTPAADDWLDAGKKALSGNFKPLVGKVLASAATGAAEKLGVAALGWMLRSVGLGGVIEDPDKAETEGGARGAEQVGHSAAGPGRRCPEGGPAEPLRHPGRSDPARCWPRSIPPNTKLKHLANLSAGDTGARAARDEIVTYIQNNINLQDGGAILHKALLSDVPGAEDILKAASAVEVGRGRFFDSESSKRVRSVAGYYALYQAQWAILIAEYQHAKELPDSFTTETLKDLSSAKIDAQEASLKPAVPSGAVVDTKNNKMWTQNFQPNPMDASAFFKRVDKGKTWRPTGRMPRTARGRSRAFPSPTGRCLMKPTSNS